PECTRELRAVTDLSMWTGRLDVALLTLADRCAARQRRRIEWWMRWLEPGLTGLVGLAVLGIFSLLYLPVTQMIGKVVP
ncbi:MAG: type II secretion system F family protein, partial [Alicyclobacillaceae bacterium]|nr:type II secretion system F family protein [Alicyclobacillaceae bacterium]